MDDGRRVVAGVHPVERGAHDGRAQVTLFVALAHALIDRLIERPARDVDVLTQLDEAHHEAGVLAVRDALRLRQLSVFLQDLQNVLAGR